MSSELLTAINHIDTALERGIIGAGLCANRKRELRAHCAALRAGLGRGDETTQIEAVKFVGDMQRIFKVG